MAQCPWSKSDGVTAFVHAGWMLGQSRTGKSADVSFGTWNQILHRKHAPCRAGHLQVQEHVDDAVKKGGKVTIGGKRPDLPEPYNKVCHNAFMHVS